MQWKELHLLPHGRFFAYFQYKIFKSISFTDVKWLNVHYANLNQHILGNTSLLLFFFSITKEFISLSSQDLMMGIIKCKGSLQHYLKLLACNQIRYSIITLCFSSHNPFCHYHTAYPIERTSYSLITTSSVLTLYLERAGSMKICR